MQLLSDFIASANWPTLAAAAVAVLVGAWLLFKMLSMLRWVILVLVILAAGGYFLTAKGASVSLIEGSSRTSST
jgi:threonine/homoserine efflux transporter RhtA